MRIRKPQPYYHFFHFAIREVERRLRKRGIEPMKDFAAVVTIGCHPHLLADSPHEARDFPRLLKERPDETVHVLHLTRQILSEDTDRRKVVKFLLAHNALVRNGTKLLLISEAVEAGMSAAEIYRRKRLIYSLDDRQIAKFLTQHGCAVSWATVQKARFEISAGQPKPKRPKRKNKSFSTDSHR